ncbi:MAG TPA: tetratricopeptide repeat protein, partial [Actinomycetota bacterium]|nr:tetratricopeptide repeat protein [Actinomycetota bacterium]
MVGRRLRRLRLAAGLTQRQLAEPRYTHAYVSSIEAGRREPSRQAVEHFARKLGMDPEELLTGRPRGLDVRLGLRAQEARLALSEGREADAEAAFRAILKEATRHRLPALVARAEEGLGLLRERRGEPERALEHHRRAEEVLRDEPPTARVDAVDGQARCLTALGDVRHAIYLLERLLDEIRERSLEDPDALSRIHAGLLYSYLEAGLYRKAAEAAAELEVLAPRLTDPERVAVMHVHVARLYLHEGRIADAERSLGRAEDAYRSLGLRTDLGFAHLARGYVLTRDGRMAEARDKLEQALAIFEETGERKHRTRARNELARVARLEGDAERAVELLERSLAELGDADAPIR